MHFFNTLVLSLSFLLHLPTAVTTSTTITAYNPAQNHTYHGVVTANDIELFSGIKYGASTAGPNRFKPPRKHIYPNGSVIDATAPGPSCPQSLGQWFPPITLGNITEISEDCLSLNVARPRRDSGNDKDVYEERESGNCIEGLLPVMVWIHGGSFWAGSNTEPTHRPDGLILESVKNGQPVIHVAMNYRLGFFGFAQSDALREEGSENAGLRDQRLAIEWVKDNIRAFGGDPENITIFGQSSGGLAVGIQLLAYGGTIPLPYQRGICESQALEPGITGNFSIDAMSALVDYMGCNTTSVHSPSTIECLRSFDTQILYDASLATYSADIAHNIGDIWLPVVDGDFLPDAPSTLISEGRFGNATYMFGWTQGDVNFYTDVSIATAQDTERFISDYLPLLSDTDISTLLNLYPVGEFTPPPGTNLTAEFYRSARIFRDVLMVCEPLYLAEAMHTKGLKVYLFDFNQTILEPIIEQVYDVSKIGVIHSSEFAYIYGNLSAYNVSGYPFNPTESDEKLVSRASSTWSTFASRGTPSWGVHTLKGWTEAYWKDVIEFMQPESMKFPSIYVIGGEREGLTPLDGPEAWPEMRKQRLGERCGFLNRPGIIGRIQY